MPIIRLYPNATTVSTNIGVHGAASANEACADPHNAPDDAGSYVLGSSAVANYKLRLGFQPMPAELSSAIIRAVTPRMRFCSDGGVASSSGWTTWGRDWNPHVYSGAVEYDGTTRTAATAVTFPALESDSRRTTDPATGVAWTVAGIDALEAGIESTTATDDRQLLTSMYLEVEYDTIAGEATRVREVLSRKLLWGRRPRALRRITGGVEMLDSELLSDVRVADYRAPSSDGAGWPITAPRLHRVLGISLDPMTMQVTADLLDLRRDFLLVRHWETHTEASPGTVEQGVARVTLGGTRALARATAKWVEDPADAAAGAVRVIEVASGHEARDQRGLLIEAAATNVMQRSSFISQLTGWTVVGDCDPVQDELLFDVAISAYSVTLVGDGANVPSIERACSSAITGHATISVDYRAPSAENLLLRISRSSDGWFLHANGTWQAATTNITIGAQATWTRYQLAFDGGGGAETFTVRLRGNASTLGRTWRVAHVQVEAGRYATSRIVTDAATVTRNADVLTIAQPAGKQILLAAGHCGVVQLKTLWNNTDLTANRSVFHNAMDANNTWQLRYATSTNRWEFIVKSGGVDYTAYIASSVTRDTLITLGWRLKTDGTLSIFLNGTKGTDVAAALPTEVAGTDLYVGSTNTPTLQVDAGISHWRIITFPDLSDAEMARLP